MPTTAFSKNYGKEYDVEQLLRVMGGDPNAEIDTTLRDLPLDWRKLIKTDVECPCCFVTGAELVAAGKSKVNGRLVRQACFRFKDGDGGNGHHPFCDFFREDENGSAQSENLVPFGSPRSEVTKAVRELVCRGVQTKIFDQRRMRDMRQWFFEAKQRAQFEVQVDPLAIDWIYNICRYARQVPIAFRPLYAEMPGFDWEDAAKDRLWREHKDMIETVWNSRIPIYSAPIRTRAQNIATRYRGQAAFDPSILQHEYRLTKQFCDFMCGNYGPLKRLLSKIFNRDTGLPPPALLALSALLLYVSDWKIETALEKLVTLTLEERVFDQNDGNFMGLNPFHDFEAWQIVRGVQELMPLKTDSYDFKKQYRDAQDQLRQEHAQWKQEAKV